MKYMMIGILFLSPFLWAEGKPLNKKLITSFYEAAERIDGLEEKFPNVFLEADKFSLADRDKSIRLLEKSKAYPEIKKILVSSGFNNLTDMYDISTRFMGSIFYAQMKSMPDGMNVDSVEKSLEASIKSMKEKGLPPEVLANMETSLREMRERNKDMTLAMKLASEADKKFVSENIDWVMSILPDEDEGEEEEDDGEYDGSY